jgi:FkbH-like protein
MTVKSDNASTALRMPVSIEKALWQPTLFANPPRRLELAALKPSWPLIPVAAAVHRNTPFEYITQAMSAFLAYGGLRFDFRFSEYDDSLQFQLDGEDDADIHVVWLDFERYHARSEEDDLAGWLGERLKVLRQNTNAPILVANWPAFDAAAEAVNQGLEETVATIPGMRIYDRRPLLAELGSGFLDRRLMDIGATTLSGPAAVLTARELGLRWLPAALGPRMKCIALDFDNTLYLGVLGEDGVDGVVLTPAHLALQKRLVALADEGIFLAAVSKNESSDVEQLLERRSDFPLRREHFSAMAVSWELKSSGLGRVAKTLRIGLDAIMFMDDNLGEIGDVGAACPMVRCIHSADPNLALAALTDGPYLLSWSRDDIGRLRSSDLAAIATREAQMAETADPISYLATLDTRLVFSMNPLQHADRLYELSNKTNQFNLALRRFKEAAVDRWLECPGPRAVTIQLSDRLSDSGVIGMMLLKVEERTLFVEELCISCRALGRKIEDLMIATAIEGALGALDCETVAFAHATGSRNAPARDWLSAFSGHELDVSEGYCLLPWPPTGLLEGLKTIPVTISWK